MNEIGERLRSLRKERGLKQVEIAEEVGITRAYLSGLETGAATPGHATFMALASFYGVSLDWLTTGKGDRSEKLREKATDLVDGRKAKLGLDAVEDFERLRLLRIWSMLSGDVRNAALLLIEAAVDPARKAS